MLWIMMIITSILPIMVWAEMSSPAQSLASEMKSPPWSSSLCWPWVGEHSLIIRIFRMNGGQKQFGYKNGPKLDFSHLLQDIASEHMIPYQGHHHHKPSLTIINEINIIIDDHWSPATAASSRHPDAVWSRPLQSHPRPAMSSFVDRIFN